jgi:hypothetical protein
LGGFVASHSGKCCKIPFSELTRLKRRIDKRIVKFRAAHLRKNVLCNAGDADLPRMLIPSQRHLTTWTLKASSFERKPVDFKLTYYRPTR